MNPIQIAVQWEHFIELTNHSQYLRNLVKYENNRNWMQKEIHIQVPPFLSERAYQKLIKLIAITPLGGDKMAISKLWHFTKETGYGGLIQAILFLDLTLILQKLIKEAITTDIQKCVPLVTNLIESCGMASQYTKLAFKEIHSKTKYKGTTEQLLKAICKRDSSKEPSGRELRKYIYRAMRRIEYQKSIFTRQCPICGKTIKYKHTFIISRVKHKMKGATLMPCCTWPVHPKCYDKRVVYENHCIVCNSDLENYATTISEFQTDGGAIFNQIKIKKQLAKYHKIGNMKI